MLFLFVVFVVCVLVFFFLCSICFARTGTRTKASFNWIIAFASGVFFCFSWLSFFLCCIYLFILIHFQHQHNMHTSNTTYLFVCPTTNDLALFIISFLVFFSFFFSYNTIVHSFHMFCLGFVFCVLLLFYFNCVFSLYYLFRFVCGVVPKLFGFVCFELMAIVCGFCDLCFFTPFFVAFVLLLFSLIYNSRLFFVCLWDPFALFSLRTKLYFFFSQCVHGFFSVTCSFCLLFTVLHCGADCAGRIFFSCPTPHSPFSPTVTLINLAPQLASKRRIFSPALHN